MAIWIGGDKNKNEPVVTWRKECGSDLAVTFCDYISSALARGVFNARLIDLSRSHVRAFPKSSITFAAYNTVFVDRHWD